MYVSFLDIIIFLYSQLDTLSKDDLIKFAKKQIAAMQKMKSRCAGSYYAIKGLCLSLTLWFLTVYKYVTLFSFSDLEKEVGSLKQQSKNSNSSSDDSALIQVCL